MTYGRPNSLLLPAENWGAPVTAEEYLWKPGVVWNRENYSVSHWSDNLKKGLTAGNEFDFSEHCSCIQFGQVGSA